jgi:hypothetical protein
VASVSRIHFADPSEEGAATRDSLQRTLHTRRLTLHRYALVCSC